MDLHLILSTGGVLIGISALIHDLISHYKKVIQLRHYGYSSISINEKLEDVTVMYKGRTVENLRVVIVKVWNSGNIDITEDDFSIPVSFCPEQTARGNSLVVAQIVEAPEASGAELYPYAIDHHSYRTALKKMLFHPGDCVTVKIIIADYGGENLDVNVTGRIKGIKAFNKKAFVPDDGIPHFLRLLLTRK
jgi:hypothetical protein